MSNSLIIKAIPYTLRQPSNQLYSFHGFYINHEKNVYFISVNHYLPILSILYEDTEKEIKHTNEFNQTSWNEIIVINKRNIDNNKLKIHKQISKSIPKVNSKLEIINNGNNIELITETVDFIPYNNEIKQPRIPYIIAKCNNKVNFQGLSGSPVFFEDKVVGVLSKSDANRNIVYIIPIYIVLKTLDRMDNNNIYMPFVDNITRIGNYVVNQNSIYHNVLKCNIPLDTYFLLEGDILFNKVISYKDSNDKVVNTSELRTYKHLISNEPSIITMDNKYKLNTRLKTYLLRNGVNMFLFDKYISEQTPNNDELWINSDYIKGLL